jgi:hypothetical protein
LILKGGPNISFVLYELLETPQDLNLFGYVGNDPINCTDSLALGVLKKCGPDEERVFNTDKLIECLSNRGSAILILGSACAAAIKIPAPPIVKIPAIIATCGLTATLVYDCVRRAYECKKKEDCEGR